MQRKNFKRLLLIFCIIIVSAVILSACAGAPAAEEPMEESAAEEPSAPGEETATQIAPEVPAEPIEPSPSDPVQYGQDSRTELYQHPDPQLREMANSVAIFVHRKQVQISGSSVRLDGYTLNEMGELGWLVPEENIPLCTGELFTTQIAPGFCTGFLIEEDLLVTAGHCVDKVPCEDIGIVFGYQLESENAIATVSTENVFYCKEILSKESPGQANDFLDYAVIQLDRRTGRTGLAYENSDQVEKNEEVAVIGHPSGLPMKIASNAVVLSNEYDSPFFTTNLDTFGSNSGSPVINLNSYQVAGILVRGTTDYVVSDDKLCIQVNRCPESGNVECSGENVTKIALVSNSIPESPQNGWRNLICFTSLVTIIGILFFGRFI